MTDKVDTPDPASKQTQEAKKESLNNSTVNTELPDLSAAK